MTNGRPWAPCLAPRFRPAGLARFEVLSRYCAWEVAWHLAHGDIGHATRRLGGSAPFHVDSASLTIHYPSPLRLERDFAPWFRRVGLMPLGLALPPSDVYPVIERHPRLLTRLMALESRLTPASWLAQLADHYWIEFERTRHPTQTG